VSAYGTLRIARSELRQNQIEHFSATLLRWKKRWLQLARCYQQFERLQTFSTHQRGELSDRACATVDDVIRARSGM
jgi:hypothetical protein